MAVMKKQTHILLLYGFLLSFIPAGLKADVGWNSFIVNFNKKLYGNGAQTWQIAPYEDRWTYFANKNGLVQFDGDNWQLFPLNNSLDARAVLPSALHKRIYVGGVNEFGYFEPNAAGELTYRSLSDTLASPMRYLGNVWGVHEADNILYFQGDERIVKLLDGECTLIDPGCKIDCSDLVNGVLYLSTDKGLRLLVGNELFPLNGAEQLPSNRIRGIVPYEDGVLVATAYHGLFYYDGQTLSPFITGAEDFMRRNEVFCITRQGNRIALGTVHNGLMLMDCTTRELSFFNENNGLQNNTVLSVAFDSSGNLWAGLDNGMAYVCLASPFTNLYSHPHHGTGYAAAVQDGYLYLGTNRGLIYTSWPASRDGKKQPEIRGISGSSGQVWNLCRVGDELFCLHDRGIFRVDGSALKRITDLTGTWTCQQVEGHPDLMYVGTYNGIWLLKKAGKEWRKLWKINNLGGSSRWFEQETARVLWIYFTDHISRVELTEDLSDVLSIKEYYQKDGFPSGRDVYVSKVKGRIYFPTPAGIYRHNPSTDRMEPCLGMDSLLGGSIPYKYLTEHGDRLMALSPYGIYITDLDAARRASGRHVHLIQSPLLKLQPDNEILVPLSDSLMVLPNEDGFALFNLPGETSEPESGLPSGIEAMYLSYPKDSLVYQVNFLGRKEVPKLGYAHNSVRFEYAVPFLLQDNEVRFQYRLNNARWSTPSTVHTKEYSNLHEGSYTFEVRTLFPDGTSASDVISFVILPPWYRSWPAYVCYLLLLVALMWALIRWDSARMNRKQQLVVVEKDQEIKEMEQEYEAEKVQREKQIIQLEKEKLEHDLQHKSQEMVNLMINFTRKSEMLTEIKTEIMKVAAELKGENTRETKRQLILINGKIDANIQSDEVLKRIEEQFDLLHNNFMKRLHEHHPGLSNNERMMCAYLKMNLSTKEIAPLLNISVRGVETMRYRLRKKLGLEREDSLTDYLNNQL